MSLSEADIQTKLINCKEQYKIAKENYEFEYASLLLEDIKNLEKELKLHVV
ncbi:hypothetical protein [Alkalihalobacterium alkalinitrilicum]|uniref:hypothetical protein n=1 Tax=Alkalihalobacterium alkalinitrilicum TaxID=427920 RepID=UPI001303DF06|nr:hypothetical protein [Alkalihalobacterium alkalinitrilicum]